MTYPATEAARSLLKTWETRFQATTPVTRACYRFGEQYGAGAADYPDDGWTPLTGDRPYDKKDGVLWVRFSVETPEKIYGIPLAGGQIRLRSFYQAPVKLYVNGKLAVTENNWLDLQTPELVLTDSAVPGTVYRCAMRIDCQNANWGGAFHAWIEYDPADAVLWKVTVMQEELTYAAGLTDGAALVESVLEPLVPALREMTDREDATGLTDWLAAVRQGLEPLRTEAKGVNVHLISHAHIDMNWLWGTQETRDLVRRDFSTVCKLLDEFPDLRFSQSQAATYRIAQLDDPDLFRNVLRHIRNGQWEVTATAWVENDTDMPSGESQARQILYTQLYDREVLGVDPAIQWAPDTFGHTANLPQLLRKSGITHYYHSRCCPWQDGDLHDQIFNHEPGHPLFWWEGADGTRMLSASMGYGGNFNLVSTLRRAVQAREAGFTDAMSIFGVGDHGGGPTRRDIRLAHYCEESPALPHLFFSTTAAYFGAVEDQTDALSRLPVHKGEMNTVFEGCYTSESEVKERNRRLETMLAETELLRVLAESPALPYPTAELEECWKVLLFQQFHDILCGSGVTGTYREAYADMQAAQDRLTALRQEALTALLKPADGAVTAVNLLPYPRAAWLTMDIPDDKVAAVNGTPCPQEPLSDGRRAVYLADLPACGGQTVTAIPGTMAVPVGSVKDEHGYLLIDGPDYTVYLRKSSGEFATYFDKHSNRYITRLGLRCARMDRGEMNTFAVTEEVIDNGMSSWAFDRFNAAYWMREGAECRLLEDGPLRKRVEICHHYKASTVTQQILFDFTTPVIRFDTDIEWLEPGSAETTTPTLSVEFTPYLPYAKLYNEVPFGVIERPVADAELPQQRFSALEDGQGGVILYNNSKYGMHITGNRMSLTLLHSSWEPDAHPDLGKHHISYAIEAYAGKLADSAVLKNAAAFQTAPVVLDGELRQTLPALPSLPAGIGISAVKRAERSGDLIVRLYEAFGNGASIELPLPAGVKLVTETCTDEETALATLPVSNGKCAVTFAPYEIKTLRLTK